MKLRIIEYEGQLFVTIGITNLRDKIHNIQENWEVFESYPLREGKSLIECILVGEPIFIKIEDAKEITERHKLEAIMILYG